MKKLLFMITLFSSLLFAQQDRFIIGVDWLNPTYPNPYYSFTPLSNTYWNLAQSLGINYAHLSINEGISNGVQIIRNELGKASARDIRILLNTYKINEGTMGRPRRWLYQAEAFYDFNSHTTGDSLYDPTAEKHWSRVNDGSDALNYIRLNTGSHSAGYAAQSVKLDNLPPDGATYYLKVRMKVLSNYNHTEVIKVTVLKGSTLRERIIYADEFSDANWKEITVLAFDKTASGPADPTYTNNIVVTDPLWMAGVPDYEVQAPVVNTAYDIQIYWYDQRNCDIDYIVLDDIKANSLFTGDYDNIITATVNNFKDHDGLGNIKIWDEPRTENFLPVRYVNQKVQGLLTGYEEKHALSFNCADNYLPQQYLAETQMKIQLADIYPISDYPIPGESNYNTYLQNGLQTNLLIPYVQPHIQHSNKFNVPYWFAPQAHSWGSGLREPSAYEIKTMVNLAICYGAKGIHYFMYCIPTNGITVDGVTLLDDDDPNNPVPRYTDNYGYPKWNTVLALNQKLASIGDELLSLTWQKSYYINNGTQPSGDYITNVQSVGDNDASTYVQLGLFKKTSQITDPNLEYFYVVNRRTMPTEQRNINITFNKSSSYNTWKVSEVGTDNSWIVSKTGSFQTAYEPGEGKLFKFEPMFVNSSETFSSADVTVTSSFTVPSGKTLNINSGSNFYFNNGIALTVNGTLNATNAIFDRVLGTWGSIIFDGSSSANSLLDDIEVRYASDIQCLNGANVTIQNSLIEYCTNGIYVYNSQPEIINNIINEPVQNGIYGEASMQFPIILDNTITKTNINQTYKEYQGIWFVNSPEMYAAHNDVSGFFWGAYFGGGTMALLTDYSITQYDPNNRFTDNRYGLASAWGSYVVAYLNNSIFGNSVYDAYATNSGELYAQHNYWGGGSANKYADGTSTIDAANYLVDDPWDGFSAIASTGELIPKELSKKEILNPSSPERVEGSPFINNFLIGLNLEKEGKINDAIAHYKQMINNETNARFGLLALAKISVKFSRDDLLNYFKELLSNPNKSQYRGTIQNLLASINLQKGNYNESMNYYNEIIKNNSSSYGGINARFEKFFAALHIKKDKELAGKLLSEIQSAAADLPNDDEDFLMRLETAEYLLYGTEYSGAANRSAFSKQNTIAPNLPKEYSLLGNYPNPFNPSTTISYTLPNQSSVELIIYDVIGREIKSFSNISQNAGTHKIIWDGMNNSGENVSSGIYLYRIKLKSLESNEAFEKTAKLMLMK